MRTLLTIALSVFFMQSYAQQVAPLLFKIEYQFIHILDKKTNDTLHDEKLVLRAAEQSSVYGRMPFDIVIEKREALPPPPPSGGAVRVAVGMPMAVVNDWGITEEALYMYYDTKKLNRVTSVGTVEYLLEAKFPVIEWQIHESTKKIGEYNCQMATGTYAGRQYTAWFTPELPVAVGPWKLNGLPGAILEASDNKEEVFFIFKRIAQAAPTEITDYEARREPVKVSESALKKARDGFMQNPVAVVQAQSGTTGNVMFRFRDRKEKFHSNEEAHRLLEQKRKNEKKVLRNPLELK